MQNKEPVVPATRLNTIRRQILDLLRGEALSARDISAAVGIAEKEVYGHLEHLQRSLHHTGGKLLLRPPECHACGFVFAKRRRLTRPSRCPVCRSESIAQPLFAAR